MKATHIHYLHPRHLRVEDKGEVLCMSPSCSDYGRLSAKSLPDFRQERRRLPRHSSTLNLVVDL